MEDEDYTSESDVSFSITVPLSQPLREFAEQVQACFPSACPWCGWKHPRDMFRQEGGVWHCMKCGEPIQLSAGAQEDWPDVISG